MKFFERTFAQRQPQQPSQTAPVLQRSEGAALGSMIEDELAKLRLEVRPAPPSPTSEASNGSVIERLTRAALASARKDAKALQQAKAADAKRLLDEDRSIAVDLARCTPPPKDGEVVGYEEYSPDFL